MTTLTAELKPCPFCGCAPVVVTAINTAKTRISCENTECHASVHVGAHTRQLAEHFWNQRPAKESAP